MVTQPRFLLKGKSYSRGVRSHKLTMEAMLRLLWNAFAKWVLERKKSNPESIQGLSEDHLTHYHRTCQEAVTGKKKENLQGQFQLLCAETEKCFKLLASFREEGRRKCQGTLHPKDCLNLPCANARKLDAGDPTFALVKLMK